MDKYKVSEMLSSKLSVPKDKIHHFKIDLLLMK